MMVPNMLRPSHYLEIFQPVVELVSVYVMNNFARTQLPTEVFLHDLPVFSDALGSNRKHSVARVIYESRSVVDQLLRVSISRKSSVVHNAPPARPTLVGVCELFAAFFLAFMDSVSLIHREILPRTNWFEVSRSPN